MTKSMSRWLVGATVLVSSAFVSTTSVPVGAAGGSTVSGTVFRDYNMNGIMDTSIAMGVAVDIGVAGILVRAFDSTGALVGESYSASDGTYTVTTSGAASADVRIEFSIPSSDPSLDGLVPSAAPMTVGSGTRNGTSIQFVTLGATNVSFAVAEPGEYCQNNPKLMTCLDTIGDAAGKTAPGAVLFSSTMNGDPNIASLTYNSTSVKATADKLGSVFGIGIDRNASATTVANAFIGTFVKRHIEYGDAGATNTIYRVTMPASGSGTVSQFITLPGTLPSHTASSATSMFASYPYAEDTAIFTKVGRIGLGDVDVTNDGTTILAVDMDETAPKFYFIPILGSGSSVTAGTASSLAIPKPSTFNGIACPGKWHPMGIGTRGNRILVGGVCGAEDTVTSSKPNGNNPTSSTAFVLEYTGARDGSGSFSTIYAMSMGYVRGCTIKEYCDHTTSTVGSRNTADWGAWNEYPQYFYQYSRLVASNPQPMLANIEIADDGALVLGFRDRFTDQVKQLAGAWSEAYNDSYPDPPEAWPQQAGVFSGADTVRVCNSAGTLSMESNGTCATGIAGSGTTDPSTAKEFYYDAFPYYGNSGNDDTVHAETLNGSTAMMPGYPGLWSTAFDISWVDQQGILAMGNCAAVTSGSNCRPSGSTGNGSRLGGLLLNFSGGSVTWPANATFAKGNGLADLEIVCNQAPVQIGNRVWIDTDMDGIQDPGETQVAGVTVHLYNSSGTLVGTAVTNAAGEYYFSSVATEAASGGSSPDAYGYGLLPGETFTVKFDNPPDYASGGPLYGYVMTDTDASSSETTDTDDLIDSDATLAGTGQYGTASFPAISVSALDPGDNDHSYDVGFYPLVALSDTVWIDQDKNGVQDAGELPLAGVTVTLYLADGTTPATKEDGSPATATTGADGTYVIDGLVPGEYRAKFTLPDGYSLTTQESGSDTTVDSNPDPATGMTAAFTISSSATGDTVADTSATTLARYVNPTIDAGVVPDVDLLVGMGDYVWIDQNRDGLQTEGELVLPGVVVTLFEADGVTPAKRFDGLPATATTDANGHYFIDGLVPGTYRAQFTLPDGYVFTTQAAGTDGTVDSNPDVTTGMTPVFTIAGSATGDTTTDSTNTTLASFVNLTIDAGVVPEIPVLVGMGNYTWIDTDRDGKQDVGETPLAGVVVTLYLPDGITPVLKFDGTPATATTDANGYYFIDGLAPGDYRALFVPPAGYGWTTQTAGSDTSVDSNPDIATGMTPVFSITASSAGETTADTDPSTLAEFVNPTIDAGFIQLVAVGNYVWVDKYNDGDQDASDPKLAGVVVTLYEADGVTPALKADGTPATATTDANGYYMIDGLAPGTYRAQFDIPDAYYFTTQNAAGTTTANDSNADATTGMTPAFTLTAEVTGNMTANTDPTIKAAYVDKTVDAGVVPYVGVGNFVWNDLNGNGLQDAGEPGIPGVTVTLYFYGETTPAIRPDGAVATATTDENGYYMIDGLLSQDPDQWFFYEAQFDLPPGYTFTTAGTGNYTLNDSNANATTGRSSWFMISPEVDASTATTANTDPNVKAGFVNLSIDAGMVQNPNILVAMGNYVWIDTDRDGIQDVGETPLEGVVVTLYEADGVTPAKKADGTDATATTDANGYYFIDGLEPGDYRALFDVPDGYVVTQQAAGTDTTADSNPVPSTGLTPVFTIYPYPLGDTVIDTDSKTVALYVNPTIDAGFVPVVSVGDLVWYDYDGDGVQDGGESGIAGVTLTITKSDGSAVTDVFGNPVTTTTTDKDGKYLFDNLPLGQYKVTVTPPSGYVATTSGVGSTSLDSSTGYATSANLTTNGASDMTLDFGFVPASVSVGNYVWFDANADGLQDSTDVPLAGVVLTITKADGSAVTDIFGNPVTTTTTDSAGHYLFDNLPLGQYKVMVTPPDGYVATTAGQGTTATDSSTGYATSTDLQTDGASDLTLDFGFVPVSVSVGDLVWIDTDRDGVQDVGEPGIPGVTLTITKADGSPVTDVFGNPVTTTTTDADGKYSFDDLPPGQYTVTVTAPDGYIATTDGSGTSATDSSTESATSTTLTSNGDRDPTLDFGFVLPAVSVGNYVWIDSNADGLQDSTDVPLAGVVLTITKADGSAVTDVYGNPVTTTTTDATGHYLFDNLPLGQYKVMVTPPTGYVATSTGAGTTVTDSSTGYATSTDLQIDGASDMTLDFGFVPIKVSVGDYVWFDTNRDGVQDSTDKPLAGVVLTITKADGSPVTDVDGNPVTTTTTDASGRYSFDHLPPGQYTVTVTPPAGMVPTSPGVGVTSADSSTGSCTSVNLSSNGQRDPTLDFGFVTVIPVKVSVGNYVWRDLNGNGYQNLNDRGIAGAILRIYDAKGKPARDVSGKLVKSQITGKDGKYLFTNLPPGRYTVKIHYPKGMRPTTPNRPGRDTNSSSWSALSLHLRRNGARDLSLDFGVVSINAGRGLANTR